MLQRVKKWRDLRRRKPHSDVQCPICKIRMKRKGRKGMNEYFRCPKCRGRMRNGLFVEAPNPDTLDVRSHEIKEMRKEMALRRLIVRLKKLKYLPYSSFQFEGRIINLEDFDKDGISFEEKRRREEELKKQEAAKRKKKKSKENKRGKENVSSS